MYSSIDVLHIIHIVCISMFVITMRCEVLNVNNNIFKVGTTAYLTMRTYTYIYKSNITIVLKIYETCSNVE